MLFLLPWTNVHCSGRQFATQSGLQAVTGDVSVAENVRALMDDRPSNRRSNRGVAAAPLVALAGLFVVAGLLGSALVLFTPHHLTALPGAAGAAAPAGAAAAVALALLLVQAAVGFPLNDSIREAQANSMRDRDDDARVAGLVVDFRADRTGWFYLELICLAVPAGLYVNSLAPNRQPRKGDTG